MSETPIGDEVDNAQRISELEKIVEAGKAVLVSETTLTGHDRCDVRSCGAQAYVRVTLTTGDLLFCGHHATAMWDSLSQSSIAIHDERTKIDSGRLDVSA